MVTLVGLGGIGSLIVALSYENAKKVVVLRPCKKSDVKGARRVGAASFKVNPSTEIGKKPALEGQLVAKEFDVYIVCLGMPWPMVLESVNELVEEPVVAGDLSCFFTPFPKRCASSALALAALGRRKGILVHALPGRYPSNASCVAENLEKCRRCFQGVYVPIIKKREELIRLVDYLYSKAPNATIIEVRNSLLNGDFELFKFELDCVFDSLKYIGKIREMGPKALPKTSRVCKGDLVTVLENMRKSHSFTTSVP